jgi:hypothetical protein
MRWKTAETKWESVASSDPVAFSVQNDSDAADWPARLTPVATNRHSVRRGILEADHVINETVERILRLLFRFR